MSLSFDILFYTPFVFVFLYLLVNFIAQTPRNVCIVVLGDIGRSPRMQYHALSFAKEGFRVYLVGYKGSKPLNALLDSDEISVHHISEPPGFIKFLPRLLAYIVKVLWQSLTLTTTLLLLPKMSSIFIQNPLSIPTMAVSYAVSRVRFCDFVIDWHNYGHTILALTLGNTHPLVRFSRWTCTVYHQAGASKADVERYERFCGRLSSRNICVTKAMKDDLAQNWNVGATVVYDRPPSMFRATSVEEQHILFDKLSKDYPVFGHRQKSAEGCTAFTKKDKDGLVVKQEQRPALLISSTSWTEDEDFGLLLSALEAYEKCKKIESGLPNLICVITGKGPLKEYYREKIGSREWEGIQFCLPWLEADDYPTLLGSADIGVCLHTSSSGLDLPMKVVDMFGCGLPVCAVDFQCIGELVQHEKNGLIFANSDQLTSNLKDLLRGYPKQSSRLTAFKQNLVSFQSKRWHQCWRDSVLPIFREIGERHSVSRPRTDTKEKDKKE